MGSFDQGFGFASGVMAAIMLVISIPYVVKGGEIVIKALKWVAFDSVRYVSRKFCEFIVYDARNSALGAEEMNIELKRKCGDVNG